MVIKQEKEFLDFYDKHADAIFRYCFYRVFDYESAKDIVQETFCKTWEYIASGNEVKNIRALVYKIAYNLIVDRSRLERPVESLEGLKENGWEVKDKNNLADQIEITLEAQDVAKAIKKLDSIYQEAVVLRYINELRPKEIAEILNESENVVSVRINRGLKQLKDLVNKI